MVENVGAQIGGAKREGGRLRPDTGSVIHPSQPIEINFPFALDEDTVNESNIQVYDTIYDRDLSAEGLISIGTRTSGTKTSIYVKPLRNYLYQWGHTIRITIDNIERSGGGDAFDGPTKLFYFVEEKGCPNTYWSKEQVDSLLVPRANTEPWKTGAEEILTDIIGSKLYSSVASSPYTTTPDDEPEVNVMYGGSYNQGRGFAADTNWIWANAWQWKLTGKQTYFDNARNVLMGWVNQFPIGPPTSFGRSWWYTIKYDIILIDLIAGFELIRDDMQGGDIRATEKFLRSAALAIQPGHEKVDTGDPSNIRSWDNAAFMMIYGATGDWDWRDYVTDTVNNPFHFQWMLDNAVESVRGEPRMWDRARGGSGNPYQEITYPVYHIEAMVTCAHAEFLAQGKQTLWEMAHSTFGWTLEDVTREYQRAVRCEAGSGFDTVEGYCVDWSGDGDPANARLFRRMVDAWKLSPLPCLRYPLQATYDLVNKSERGSYPHIEQSDLHLGDRGPTWKGYPAASYAAAIQAPPAPTNLQAHAYTNYIKLTWDQPTPTDEYGAPLAWIISTDGTERGRTTGPSEYVVSGAVLPDTEYAVKVEALNAAGQTSSATISVKTERV